MTEDEGPDQTVAEDQEPEADVWEEKGDHSPAAEALGFGLVFGHRLSLSQWIAFPIDSRHYFCKQENNFNAVWLM